jgi:hypothetical protein
MSDASIKRFLFGGTFVVVGLVLIIFHNQLRRIGDAIRRSDPLLRWGDWWTREYTRGGLIAIRVVGILFGLFFIVEGILIIAHMID